MQNALVSKVSQIVRDYAARFNRGAFLVLVRGHITQVKHDKTYLTFLSTSTRLSSGGESSPDEFRVDCWWLARLQADEFR
jgi:hypothetical protein